MVLCGILYLVALASVDVVRADDTGTRAETMTTANIERITTGILIAGIFPDDIQHSDDSWCQYQESDIAMGQFRLDVEHWIQGIPEGDEYQLEIEGHIDDENIIVTIWNWDALGWEPVGFINDVMDTWIIYPIPDPQIRGGEVMVRYEDMASDIIPSNLWLDFVGVRSTSPDPNLPPVIGHSPDYFDVTVGNYFDEMFTATDPEGDALVWEISTDNPHLSLWYDDDLAGVTGVPDTMGLFSVTLTVSEILEPENFDTFTFTLEVVTEDLTECIDCYLQGKIVLESVFLNKYTFHLAVTRLTCNVHFFRWDFGDGSTKTTRSKTVDHWYWGPWFSADQVNVSVTAYTDCGISRPVTDSFWVDNTWETWICLFILLVVSFVAMRKVFKNVAGKRTARKRKVKD